MGGVRGQASGGSGQLSVVRRQQNVGRKIGLEFEQKVRRRRWVRHQWGASTMIMPSAKPPATTPPRNIAKATSIARVRGWI